MAQLVAHLTGSEGVRGSSPLSSTTTTTSDKRARVILAPFLPLGGMLSLVAHGSECQQARGCGASRWR